MSLILDEDEKYIYEILQEKHLEESSQLLANTFTKDNPLEVFMKTTYEQFYLQAFAFSKAVLNEYLSVVAIDKQTKQIHGLVQAGDLKRMKEQHLEEIDSTDQSMEIYIELERRFLEQYGQFKENQLGQIIMAGVRQDCSGKGLGTKLHQILLNHCRQRGFQHIIVEPSNPTTYYIYTKKLHGKEFTSIHLSTFVFNDGRKLFEHYHGDVQLIVFHLQ